MPYSLKRVTTIVLCTGLCLVGRTSILADSTGCGNDVDVHCKKIAFDIIRCKALPQVNNRIRVKVAVTDPPGQDIRCDYCVTSWSGDPDRTLGLRFKATIAGDCDGVAAASMVLDEKYAAAVLIQSDVLIGASQVPPSGSPANGQCSISLDDLTGSVTVNGDFSGLTGGATGAHVHGLAPVGVNAPPILPLSVTAGSSGTISGSGVLTMAEVNGMLMGETYVDVHSSSFPNGEIRGQLFEPAGQLLPTLKISKSGGNITLVWDESCVGQETDFEIYEGQLGDFTSHEARFCTTGWASLKTLTPAANNRYYLVVPRTATNEGGYCQDSNGAERPPALVPCLPQLLGTCP